MKRILLAVAFGSSMFMTSNVQAQTITTPRTASPAAEITQTLGISTISINYSRPTVRGRDVWGALVPYGYNNLGFGTATAAPWRAGANENTIITFSDDAKVEGKDIAAGTYALFIGVHEDGKADIIFSQNSTSWGSYFYRQEEDVLRVQVASVENAMTERLTYDFINLSKNSATVVLNWEKKQFPFKVEYAVDKLVINNAKNMLRSTAGFGFQGPLSAAQYCLQNNLETEQGIKWVDQAIAANPNFNGYFIKSGLLTKQGKTNEASKLNDKAVELANKAQLNFMGYQMVGQKNNDKALEYFQLNVKRNPKDANVHDSLAECYKTMGNNKAAIKEFKVALGLNPAANVKANSVKNLKELGVDTSSY